MLQYVIPENGILDWPTERRSTRLILSDKEKSNLVWEAVLPMAIFLLYTYLSSATGVLVDSRLLLSFDLLLTRTYLHFPSRESNIHVPPPISAAAATHALLKETFSRLLRNSGTIFQRTNTAQRATMRRHKLFSAIYLRLLWQADVGQVPSDIDDPVYQEPESI